MNKQAIMAAALVVATGLGGLGAPGTASADNIFRSMNPFNWFFGDDWDDDYYYRHRYWGYGWGGPYGWYDPWRAPGSAGDSTVIVVQGEDQQQNDAAAIASAHAPE
jgi:hypothetical protein